MTPQQKDEDEMSVCVALSLLSRVNLALILFSSSLSSDISASCFVRLGCSNALTRLSVLVLVFCFLANLVLTLLKLSRAGGIDRQQKRMERGGRWCWYWLRRDWKEKEFKKEGETSREERPTPMISISKRRTRSKTWNKQGQIHTISYHLIEKSIFQLDNLTPMEKVS